MNSPDAAAIEAFVAAAEAGSFTAAAESLERAPSSVSRSVARLEAALGLRLFSRTTRRVQLTPEGRLVYQRYREVLRDLRAVQAEVTELGTGLRGRLRISLPISYGRKVLLPMLMDFLARYPGVELGVSLSDRYVDLLEDGFDAAVRIGGAGRGDYIARPLSAVRFGVYASPAWLAEAGGGPQHPGMLGHYECIAYAYPMTERRFPWTLSVDGAAWTHAPAGRLVLDHGEALVDAAIAGGGLIHVQDYMVAEPLRAGQLVPVLEPWWPAAQPVAVIYREPQRLSRRVAALVAWLQAAFGRARP